MSNKKKICVVTAARSEYGLLRWLIDEVHNDDDLILQLVVTGSHLSPEFGHTYKEIEKDGYVIDVKADIALSAINEQSIAKSMGNCAIAIADALEDLQPDMVVVLGDRYELLPICSTALVMNVPIAHISGGDITEGAIDDQIRNAITMLSNIHFPGVQSSGENITRMTNSDKNIFVVGEPGLDNFRKMVLLNRDELAASLSLNSNKRWILVTQHSETKVSLEENLQMAKNIVKALDGVNDIQVVITMANADLGGTQINDYFKEVVTENPEKYSIYPSLGQLRYMSFMKQAYCIIGNSSSGIVEAPYLARPVINIGERQKGRYIAKNVIQVSGYDSTISNALNMLMQNYAEYSSIPDHYYGDGETSIKIKNHIKEYLSYDG
jgi:UDP-hydrolysing UDP-N-acetyl-D-glucosamine 2-epimerase